MKVGLISDTHGLFREELYDLLKDVDRIIHLGDIGDSRIIEKLKKLAPSDFILGNVDKDITDLQKTKTINIENVKIYMIHDLKEIKVDEMDEDIRIVAYGHSHRPNLEERDNIIYINPGSVGRRRFKLPITYGIMNIGEDISIKIYDLFSGDVLYDETYYI